MNHSEPPEDLRVARGERSRRAALAAAKELLAARGFEALSMSEIADRAGISRRALYNHFPTRTKLVGALFDFIAETEGLADSTQRVWQCRDGASALREWAAHVARYHPRLLRIDRAVSRVRDTDPDAMRHWQRVRRAKLENCERLVRMLTAAAQLAPGWTEESAARMIYALTTSDLVEALMVDMKWSERRFADHFGRLLVSTFVSRS